MDIRPLTDRRFALGEGPLWDVDEQRLYWIDGSAKRIWRAAPDGSELTGWDVPSPIGSLALRRSGGAVVALETGLHLFDFKTGEAELIAHPEQGLDQVRLNDGKVDPQGGFVVGSVDMGSFPPPMGTGAAPRGRVYRLAPDLSLTQFAEGMGCTNGPCFSPDGRIFYLADTLRGTIFAHDWDDAAQLPKNQRVFARFGAHEGMPDGGTVDAEGYVWSAAFGRGIARIAPDGTFDRLIELPLRKVSSVMFGGPELDILFATSLDLSVPPEDGPHAGTLYAIRGLGIRGLPERRFAG